MMFQTVCQNLSVFSFIAIFALLTSSICESTIAQNHESKIRGMFVFGSSTVDNGNNNFLENTLARADYLPYGIDFLLGPTGRFSSGKNVIDVLGEKLKLPNYLPPFNDPSTKAEKILHGVDYASSSSGLLDSTGVLARNVTTFSQQIKNFENVTLPELELLLGKNRREILSEFLFVVGVGANDFTRNYFPFHYYNVSLEAFTNNITTTLSSKLERLYNLGARKFVLMAIYPVGCSPMVKREHPSSEGCLRRYNRAAELYNANLKIMVDALRTELPDSNLVLVDAYKIIMDILKNPSSQGFRDATNSCCEVGFTGILCKRRGSVCKDRSEYVYFDAEHPTEAVNLVIATKAFSSHLKSEVYPFNVEKLSEMASSSHLKSEVSPFNGERLSYM